MTKFLEATALVVLIAMFVMIGLNWSDLPERMPAHYNAAGEPDRWGSKDAVWILPAIGTALYLMTTAVSRIASVSPDARQLLTAVKVMAMTTFAYITWSRIAAPDQGLGRAFVPVIVLFSMALIAMYYLRLRRHHRP